YFFFSSRRRHTRWPRDWSSDVCSSDLDALSIKRKRSPAVASDLTRRTAHHEIRIRADPLTRPLAETHTYAGGKHPRLPCCGPAKIGRASCRERVENPGVGAESKGTDGD